MNFLQQKAFRDYQKEYNLVRFGDVEELAFSKGWEAYQKAKQEERSSRNIQELFIQTYTKIHNCQAQDVDFSDKETQLLYKFFTEGMMK